MSTKRIKKKASTHPAVEEISNALPNFDSASYHEGSEPTEGSHVADEQVDVLEDAPDDNGGKNNERSMEKKKKSSKVEASKAKKTKKVVASTCKIRRGEGSSKRRKRVVLLVVRPSLLEVQFLWRFHFVHYC